MAEGGRNKKNAPFLDRVEAAGAARSTTMEDWRRAKLGGAPAPSREGPEGMWRRPGACKDLGGSPPPAALPPWKGPYSSQAGYDPWWEEHDRAVARNLSDCPEEAEGLEEAIMMSLRDQGAYPRKPQGLADDWREVAAEIEEAKRVSLKAFEHETACCRRKWQQEKEDEKLARALRMKIALEEEELQLQQWSRTGRQRQEANDSTLALRLGALEESNAALVESDAALARSLAGQ